MWKPGRSEAERHFGGSQSKDDKVIKQKEKTERERDTRMTRLRDLRLAKEADKAAEQVAAEKPTVPDQSTAPESGAMLSARLPRVHPHRS